MHYDESVSNNEPLKDVRGAMGKIAFVKGNPLTKTEISLNISKNYFLNEIPLASNLLPANLRGTMPIFIFGLTDFKSGFAKGTAINSPVSPWSFASSIGEKLSAEMAIGWQLAGFWTGGFGADWAGGAVLNCSGIIGGAAGIISRLNFWQVNHKYRINFIFDNTPNTFANTFSGFNAAGGYPNLNHDYYNILYDYIPNGAALQGQSNNLQCRIQKLSIKEILGFASLIGEPSVGIYGYNKNIVLSTGVKKGDLVLTYTAIDYTVPVGTEAKYICEIIIHCDNIAYGTFLNSFSSELITINTLRYIVPIANINQFINPLTFFYQTLFGKYFEDDVDPRNYITNKDFQQQIADIPINLSIDKNLELILPMDYDCDNLNFVMFVEKVEQLTHK